AGVVAATIEQHARRAGRAWLAWPCSLLVVGVSCWESRIAPVALLPAPPVPPVYSWLARRKGPILEIPMDHVGPGGIRLADSRYVYLSTWHHQPIVNGYSGYAPAAYPLVLGLGAELPGNEPLATLSRLTGARWLLVHLWNLTPAERSPWEAPGAPVPAVRFGQDVVFAIPPPAENWQANYQQPPEGMTLAGTPVAILRDADAADIRMSDPHLVGAGTTTPVTVEVRNAGVQTWPALTVDADRRVMLALRWDVARTAPTPAIRSGPEFPLPRDLKPGEAMTMRVVVGAPSIRGAYDLVAEIRQGVQALPTGPGRHDTRVRVEIS